MKKKIFIDGYAFIVIVDNNESKTNVGNDEIGFAGDCGKVSVGDYGLAFVGRYGKASAGEYGTIQIKWWDNKTNRYRISIGYVGENGIEPNVAYRCDECGNFVKVEE
jgi:hypothetical protein